MVGRPPLSLMRTLTQKDNGKRRSSHLTSKTMGTNDLESLKLEIVLYWENELSSWKVGVFWFLIEPFIHRIASMSYRTFKDCFCPTRTARLMHTLELDTRFDSMVRELKTAPQLSFSDQSFFVCCLLTWNQFILVAFYWNIICFVVLYGNSRMTGLLHPRCNCIWINTVDVGC